MLLQALSHGSRSASSQRVLELCDRHVHYGSCVAKPPKPKIFAASVLQAASFALQPGVILRCAAQPRLQIGV